MSEDRVLIRIELSFTSTGSASPQAYGDRIREAVAQIVGRDAMDEFRVRTLPLSEPKGKGGLRPID
jgi:hypothetical protein